jgi:HlyD family secretion protein
MASVIRPSLFRQAPARRLSSPDDLDKLLQVTDPRGWIALSAVGLLIVSLAGWAFVGSVPVKVAGRGILLKSGGLQEIAAATSGRIVDVAVNVGHQVKAGQIVVRIAQPGIADRLLQFKLALGHATAEHRQTAALGKQQLDLELALFDQQQQHLHQSIEAARQSLVWLEERREAQQQLVNEGRLTKQALINTLQQHEAAKQRIQQSDDQLADLKVKRLQSRGEYERALQQSQAKMAEAAGRVEQLEHELGLLADVVSSHTGRVVEVMVGQGSVVDTGMPLMSLDLTGRTVMELAAVLYVSARDGKRLKPGMPIQIAPATVRPEEYGQLLGRVTYVSDFPTTTRGMQRVLKHPELIQALQGGTPPHEVHAELLPDPDTVSGYRWSSSRGPALRIQSGTMCTAQITVDARRPIELVVPFIRRTTGM